MSLSFIQLSIRLHKFAHFQNKKNTYHCDLDKHHTKCFSCGLECQYHCIFCIFHFPYKSDNLCNHTEFYENLSNLMMRTSNYEKRNLKSWMKSNPRPLELFHVVHCRRLVLQFVLWLVAQLLHSLPCSEQPVVELSELAVAWLECS